MTEPSIAVVPANRATWDDLQAVFGTRGDPFDCQCQWFKLSKAEWRSSSQRERAARLREQTRCGRPRSTTTSGLVAYLDGEPAGWCAVQPRVAYGRLRNMRVPWIGRAEDPKDEAVWAVTCFVTRATMRRRGVSRALLAAAVDAARARGARALEGYPVVSRPGQVLAPAELYHGDRSLFAGAGFVEVSRPTPRRTVMRIDLAERRRS